MHNAVKDARTNGEHDAANGHERELEGAARAWKD
jgi:hypothetical protein